MNIDAVDQVAIIALYAAYNRSIDAGDILGWLGTFTIDGEFHHPARIYAGQAGLSAFITSRSAQLGSGLVTGLKHWNDPIVFTGDANSVRASCGLVVTGAVRETGKPAIVAQGRYEDSLIRTNKGWRFKERRLSIV